jgi:hypothetical protein
MSAHDQGRPPNHEIKYSTCARQTKQCHAQARPGVWKQRALRSGARVESAVHHSSMTAEHLVAPEEIFT